MVVAVILALGCMELSGEPARPAGLPAEAFWLGGPDGGVFVLLKRQNDPAFTSYTGAVYYPDGSLWYKGQFILEPAGGRPIDPTNRGQFAGWDGTQILLQDGRALVAKRGKQLRRSSHPD
jgi:hypothetical protein